MRQYNNNRKQSLCDLPVVLFVLSLFSVVYANATSSSSSSYSDSRIVKSLPGFSGDLPFKLYTGYIGVGKEEEVQLFYYFFESENDPKSDPLMLWLAGGPGCSAIGAITFEHIGPFCFNYTGLQFNFTTSTWKTDLPLLQLSPYSWTKYANIIFIDSPIGTGYTYGTTTESYNTSDILASQQIYDFLQKWLFMHPQYATNPFYIGASSYSGMIAPYITQEILKGNEDEDGSRINLKGYVLGSPFTDPNKYDKIGRLDFIHRVSILSDELYELCKASCGGSYWNTSSAKCDKNMGYAAYLVASLYDEDILEDNTQSSKPRTRNPIWTKSKIISNWVNNAEVREALHVREGTVGDWSHCNQSLRSFVSFDIKISSSVGYHQYLKEKPIRALIYSGDQELTTSYVGTLRWIKKLNAKINDLWRPWFLDNQVAGYVTEYSYGNYNLTFNTIKGAGHCPSMYSPRECSTMFHRWITTNPL